jgi:hypothetical protein
MTIGAIQKVPVQAMLHKDALHSDVEVNGTVTRKCLDDDMVIEVVRYIGCRPRIFDEISFEYVQWGMEVVPESMPEQRDLIKPDLMVTALT